MPRRPWYKHTIYAPGFYTGYGVKTMPGIREAIEQRNWKEAQDQIEVDAKTINDLADYLKKYGIKIDAVSKPTNNHDLYFDTNQKIIKWNT